MDGWRLMDGQGCFHKTKKDAAWPAASLRSLHFAVFSRQYCTFGTWFACKHVMTKYTLWREQRCCQHNNCRPSVRTHNSHRPSTPSPRLIFTQPVSRILSLLSPQQLFRNFHPTSDCLDCNLFKKHHPPQANSSSVAYLSNSSKSELCQNILLMKSSDISALRACISQVAFSTISHLFSSSTTFFFFLC